MKAQPSSAPETLAKYYLRKTDYFFDGENARALLRMPGCHEVLVNEAHKEPFQYRFRTPRSEPELLKFLRDEVQVELLEKTPRNLFCYCYPADSIISVVGEHCIFERAFKRLRRKKTGTGQVEIAAFRKSQNGQREYQLYRVKLRWLNESCREYLDVVYTKLLGLTVSVHTDRTSASGAASHLTATTLLDGEEFIKPKQCLVKQNRSYASYNFVYESFSNTIASLKENACSLEKAEKKLLARMERHKELVDYDAVQGFVSGIFHCTSDSTNGSKTTSVIIQDLEKIQVRLFDSIIVVDSVIRTLSKKFETWPNVEFL